MKDIKNIMKKINKTIKTSNENKEKQNTEI